MAQVYEDYKRMVKFVYERESCRRQPAINMNSGWCTVAKRKSKLNTMRVLDKAEAPYAVLTFPDTIHSADGVAEHLGIPLQEVYKTLVVERPAGNWSSRSWPRLWGRRNSAWPARRTPRG